MKNKRLVIILSVFSFLVLVAVLCSTVFTVKKVSLNWLTTKSYFLDMDDTIIADVKTGESVFLVDKQSIIDTLEGKYPYLKVVSAEVKFPNKLVLHTAERQELYSLKLQDGKYAIMDSDCKVLRFATETDLSGMSLKPIPLILKGYVYNDNNFLVSQVANMGWIKNVITNLSVALYECGYQEVDSKNNISGLTIDVSGYENKMLVDMSYSDLDGDGGTKIEILQISDKLSEKFRFAIGVYDGLTASQKSHGKIQVYSTNGVVGGDYSEEV